jgi:hypothetical protein
MTEITIPSSVTSIGKSSFEGCGGKANINCGINSSDFEKAKFTEVVIDDSVTWIGYHAFRDCTSLTSVIIPDSVTEIGSHTFRDCTSLTSVTIGNSVTSIGCYAFADCSSLKEVYCKPTTPPTGGDYMFSYYYYDYYGGEYKKPIGCKIYVPAESVEAYKSAVDWKFYADYIKPYNF